MVLDGTSGLLLGGGRSPLPSDMTHIAFGHWLHDEGGVEFAHYLCSCQLLTAVLPTSEKVGNIVLLCTITLRPSVASSSAAVSLSMVSLKSYAAHY